MNAYMMMNTSHQQSSLLRPLQYVEAATAVTASSQTHAAKSMGALLLLAGDDCSQDDFISLSSAPLPLLSSTRSSSSSSSSSSSDDEELDMCQLVEAGLLEDVVDSIDEGKAALATRILENIDQLIDLEEWIKSEEPFTNWLEDKNLMTMMMDSSGVSPLPTFGEVLPQPVTATHIPATTATHNLLREFESVFDSVEELGKQQQQQQQQQQEKVVVEQLTPPDSPHMAEVEALVRCRAEEQLGAAVTDVTHLTVPPSPSNSSSSSSSSMSSYGCYEDGAAATASSLSSSDPDYPDSDNVNVNVNVTDKQHQQRNHRKQPYSVQRNNSDERRSRKKEQNKNAATRYRQKKKAEVEEIAGEERELQQRNDLLQTDVVDVQREVRYLKSLMRDLFRAKGLLQ